MKALTPQSTIQRLEQLIAKYHVGDVVSVDGIRTYIYNSRGKPMEAVNKYHKKFLRYFPHKTQSLDEMNEILHALSDAWNCFPHRALGGKSPQEKAAEAMRGVPPQNQENSADEKSMPDMIVGGHRMRWDDYWAMIKEMEKQQEPFKKWIEEECLPQYQKYLQQTYKGSATDRHYAIADYFFLRALKLGFVDLEQIHPRYVQIDYPRWFQTHVLDMEVKPAAIRESLGLFFNFLELMFQVGKKEYGF